MDHLGETLALGGVIMHHDKCRHKQCGEKKFPGKEFSEIFISTIFRVIGLQVQD